MEKEKRTTRSSEIPLYCLNAFSAKATSADFYIENLSDHLREHKFVSQPHKHDFYLILFIIQGSGVHTIDFNGYPVQPNALFLMTPGQVHSWNLSPDTEGFIIFFTKEFYQMHRRENSLLEFPFYHSLVATPVIRLEKPDPVNFAIKQMFAEYNLSATPNLRILRAYLDILLLEAAKDYTQVEIPKVHGATFKLRKLEQLIEKNFKTLRQPGDYAARMNLAPAYLNTICKNNLGKTLTELIQGRTLLEAKRLFAYSDLNVNEVATKLNFSDTSYFIRWFKKNSLITPDEFRKSLASANTMARQT